MNPLPDGTLLVGDDHNLTSNRTSGDPHPQYRHKLSPLAGVPGGSVITCPVSIVDGSGNPVADFACTPTGNYIHLHITNLNGFKVTSGAPAFTTRFEVNHLIAPGSIAMYLDGLAHANFVTGKMLRHVSQTVTLSVSDTIALATPTHHIVRLNPTGNNRVLHGIVADTAGALLGDTGFFKLINVAPTNSGFNINIANQSISAAEANRIITGTMTVNQLFPDEAINIWYDATTQRWRIIP